MKSEADRIIEGLREKLRMEKDEVNPLDSLDSAKKVKVKRLRVDAIIPSKAHESDSGFDLYASEDVIVEPGDTVKVPLGIAIEPPKGYEMQIRPRSGISSKTKLRVQFGTVDTSYRGEIKVTVDNIKAPSGVAFESEFVPGSFVITNVTGEDILIDEQKDVNTYIIRKGERIAQGVIQQVRKFVMEEATQLDETERGEGGFGSSGV